MKKCFLHILLVGVLGMLAVSCSDEYDSMGLDSRQAQVVFSVAMDTPVSRSRAAANDSIWGSDYAPSNAGDAYDNRIDINQFIVKIVDDEKEYKIKDIIKWKTEGAENVYKFVGVVEGIDQSTELTNPKVYVYANMGTTEPAETFSQNAANIPMWGVKSVEGNKTFAPGTRVDLEEISLLRAMAKLEVSLNDEMFKEYALTGATLNKHNPTGNTLPMLPNGFDGSTEDLSFEGVLNPNNDNPQDTLALASVVTDSSYVVYLPEVKNEELKITVQLKQKKVDESGNVIYGSEEEGTFSLSSDVVRNHWYKYNITGFAASQIQVSYETVPWTNVNISVGGEGFLFLNKDVVQIINANVDLTQLKFSSSSPIDTIYLSDVYKHHNNGSFTEETVGDGVYAYYIDKYGQLVQLGTDPGYDVTLVEYPDYTKDQILKLENNLYQKESVDVQYIRAEVPEKQKLALNGDVHIYSPILAVKDNDDLNWNSHYNTVRYLEFVVRNIQGLEATFRVEQLPLTNITSEEGFYSFRDDHVLTDDPLEKPFDYFTYDPNFKSVMTSSMYLVHPHDFTDEPRPSEEVWASLPEMKLVRPEDFKGEPDSVYWSTPQQDRKYAWMKKADKSYTWLFDPTNTCPTQGTVGETWVEIRYGFYANTITYNNGKNTKTFQGIHRPRIEDRPYSDYFYRDMFRELPGELAITNKSYKGTGLSPYYKAEVFDKDGNKHTRVFRDHYRWNAQPVFWSKFVKKYYDEPGQGPVYTDANGRKNSAYKLKGQVDMYEYGPSEDGGKTWGRYVYSTNLYRFANNRMYKIKTTSTSDLYTIGYPSLNEDGETMNTPSNARLISPSLMLASQLGETNHQQFMDNAAYYDYIIPDVKEMYRIAARHCREYVETTFKDDNGNHKWDEGEEIVEYRNWRLPTKSEIEMIISYQSNSRAMDRVLDAQYYYCVTGNADSDDLENIHNWVSSEIPNYDNQTSRGYYIRCVRDVKSNEKK